MKLPLFQIDAFTSHVFAGNPAAVCPLEAWLDDFRLQAIAAENNLSETAFLVRTEAHYQIRWFTPVQEVDLCGHATLAAAFVVFHCLEPGRQAVCFASKSGWLPVEQQGDRLLMKFPVQQPQACSAPADLVAGLRLQPREVFLAQKYLAVYDSEDEVRTLQPDFELLKQLDCLGVIVTAPGKKPIDFVSRFFAPRVGIPEDPVTGSAHCTLVPYWSNRLGKTQLQALQVSRRGGELFCEQLEDQVIIAGQAVKYLEGMIYL
ncbi:MAG TPA: PhzF family phenazine biosynthesis protein [Candidatus Caenarcaniphilales bacterium]